MTEATPWHGEHSVPEGQMITVAIGPLSLSLAHRPGEWRIGWRRSEGSVNGDCSVSELGPIEDPEVELSVQRFLTRQRGEILRVCPLLADRPVVARPELPLRVPAGDEVQVFISTPIWVRLELTDPERRLMEIPTLRPSDTWFGPDTRRGVVAYASQTSARLDMANLPPVAHRAITSVTIRNRCETVLPLERISVPAPDMALFADSSGALWTASIVATRNTEAGWADVELKDEPPPEASDAARLSEPRNGGEKSVLSRAFEVLVG